MIVFMVKEYYLIEKVILNILVIMLITNSRELGNIFIIMENITLENGLMIKEMEREYFIMKIIILNTLVILLMINMRDMVIL